MATVSLQPEQKTVCVNPSMGLVFFEDQAVAYNYKTDQWSKLSSVEGQRFFGVQDNSKVLGTIMADSGTGFTVAIHDSEDGNAVAQDATFTTGAPQLTEGRRSIIEGVRPLGDGVSASSVRIGAQELISDSVTWATGSSVNSRTGMSNFRAGDGVPEGRYLRLEMVFSGGFTTAYGADIEFFPSGEV